MAVEIDLLLDPFGSSWPDVREAAVAAEQAGFGGIWTWDHLAGSVHGQSHVLECWTVLSALASAVPRIMLGSLVLNVANRPAGTLAVMAATLQHVSGGRLLLGLGAGGGPDTPYASEQLALGREVGGDVRRRRQVEETIATLRQVWSGSRNGVRGFLQPNPPVPIIVGGFGPKMAELAGRLADGMNIPANAADLVAVTRTARQASGATHKPFLVTGSAGFSDALLQRESPNAQRLSAAGFDRLILAVRPPYPLDKIRTAQLRFAGQA
jgi:alkanesulfonate monooxygenase SsuD/methylene tetrahydromethanopterin reductase-like flavin-dependent oxidoreductase (luciferase family)